jgi:hypothetical protein
MVWEFVLLDSVMTRHVRQKSNNHAKGRAFLTH